LPLILQALERGVPLLAICRGFQELNVALGGTLHAEVHGVPGRDDHRAPQEEDLDLRYGPRHPVRFVPGGAFERIAGSGEVWVNSLHRQGIDRLAPGLVAEGHAPDGTVEAVRAEAAGFALGVQWHPEYKAAANPFSMKLYGAFGKAARRRAAAR
jgi:putative glutamine amidotransferase